MLLSWMLLVLLASRPTKVVLQKSFLISAAKLTLPSNMLPMLRLLNKKRWFLLQRRLPSQPDKNRARI